MEICWVFMAYSTQQVITVPLELRWLGDTPVVTMGEISEEALNATFWDEAIIHARRTGLVSLDDVVLEPDLPPLRGCIYHLTRCGSTALLRQLGAVQRTIALSEPFIFLQLLEKSSDTVVKVKRLQRLAGLFQIGFASIANQIVIKWPTLMCRYWDIVEQALPETKSLFLYRDPVEILASIEEKPLGRIEGIPDRYLSGPNEDEMSNQGFSQLETVAHMIAANARWMARSSQTPRLNYAELPKASWKFVAPYFGIDCSESERTAMEAAGRQNAKRPSHQFAADSVAKQKNATVENRDLAEKILNPAFVEMEASLLPLDSRTPFSSSN
jgi:hypothetical protein